MDNKDFDHIIKKALEDFQASRPEDAWEHFEPFLPNALDEAFDNGIKEKLSNLKTPSDPLVWARLTKELDEWNDEQLDETIKEKLESHQDVYDSSTWPVLLNRLKEWEELRRHFWATRISEVAIIFLLLLTFWNVRQGHFGPIFNLDNHPLVSDIHDSQEFIDKKEGIASIRADESTNNKISKDATTFSGSHTTTEIKLKSQSREIESQVNSTAQFSKTTVNEELDQSQNARSNSNETTLESGHLLGDHVPRADIFALDIEEGNLEVKEAENNIESTAVLNLGPKDQITFPPLSTIILKGLRADQRTHVDLQQPEAQFDNPAESLNGKGIWVSMLSHIGLNMIHTPGDTSFESQNTQTLSYGSGGLVAFAHDRWFIESGLEFEIKTVYPNRNVIAGDSRRGYYNFHFRQINMRFINIPLQLRYHIVNHKDHQFYLIGGVKMHISSVVNYDITRNRLDQRGNFNFNSPPEAHEVFSEEQSVSYFTTNVGFGYQKNLSDRMALFLQPSFECFFQKTGIAPHGDRINNLRFDFGARVRLK